EQIRLQRLSSGWGRRRGRWAGIGPGGLSTQLRLGLSVDQVPAEHEAGDADAESRDSRSGCQGHRHVPWDLEGAEAGAADRQGLQLNVVLSCEFQIFNGK